MAVAHLSVKIGKAGKGAVHAEYVSREGKYKQRLNQGEKLEAVESGNMPKWAEADPMYFWQMADVFERKNGSVYREHEIALPRELSKEQRIELVRSWVEKELGSSHAYTWAIHNKIGLDGLEQPHLHLMFSDRLNDGIERSPEQYFKRFNPKNPEKGGCKKANYQASLEERKEALKALRQRWEKLHNATLISYGIRGADISMLSYKERGISQVAQPKLSPIQSNALHQYKSINRALDYSIDNSALDAISGKEIFFLRNAYSLNGGYLGLKNISYQQNIYMDNLTNADKKAIEEQWVVAYFHAQNTEAQKQRSVSQVLVKQEKAEITIKTKLKDWVSQHKALSALEMADVEAEYNKLLEGAKEQEKRLEQARSHAKDVASELELVQTDMKRLEVAFDGCVKMMADAEKRIAELEGQLLGKWRNSHEIKQWQAYLEESKTAQEQREVLAQNLVQSQQKLSETLKEAKQEEVKAKEDLELLRSPLREFGVLYRLAKVEPEKREMWKAVATKREASCIGLLPSSHEKALERELGQFQKQGQKQQYRRDRH